MMFLLCNSLMTLLHIGLVVGFNKINTQFITSLTGRGGFLNTLISEMLFRRLWLVNVYCTSGGSGVVRSINGGEKDRRVVVEGGGGGVLGGLVNFFAFIFGEEDEADFFFFFELLEDLVRFGGRDMVVRFNWSNVPIKSLISVEDNTCATTSGDVFWKILEMPESLIMVFMVVSILIEMGKGSLVVTVLFLKECLGLSFCLLDSMIKCK